MGSSEKVVSYKGFNKNWRCRGFQYEVGKSFVHDGEVKACDSGFHACEYPLDIFNYYPPARSRFAVVEQSGTLSRHDQDSKVASESILVVSEIGIEDLVKAAIEYTRLRCDPVDGDYPIYAAHSRGAACSTENWGVASSVGHHGFASATGPKGAASATGVQGAALVSGVDGAASATGHRCAASVTGYRGAASATGERGAASATGTKGAASATGNGGAASATGRQGAASATGEQGVASVTGEQGVASATGYRGAASATEEASVAVSIGFYGSAKASEGSAIVLVFRDDNGGILHIRSSKVGENGVKPDVWYTLDSEGNFLEAEQ